jgi:hypothetical protein
LPLLFAFDPQVPSPILGARAGQFGEGVLPSKSSMPLAHIGGLLPSTFEVITFLYKDCETNLLPFVHPKTLLTPPNNLSKRNKRQERNSENSRVARELDFVGSEPLS